MVRSPRALGVLACALVCVLSGLLVGGCSEDDPKPDIADPSPSAEPVSTPATASTAPTSSPSAALGPEETVRAWVEAWNHALRSGQTADLRAFNADSCRGCEELIGPVETILEAGGAFTGGEWRVDGLTVVSVSDGDAKVNLGVEAASGSTLASAGAEPSAYPASKHLLRFELVKRADAWLFSVIEVLS